MKLLTEEDKSTRKCQKREQKVDMHKYELHRGHDDSHRAMMGTYLAPKELTRIYWKSEAYLLHRGHDGSEAHYGKL
jgi:hypothetical protein